VRSSRADRHRRRSWTRPFRRTWRAIEASLRLTQTSRRVIEASERVAAERPLHAAGQLALVSTLVGRAMAQLECAAAGLRKTSDRVAESPELALDAPAKLMAAAVLWARAAVELDLYSAQFVETSARMLERTKELAASGQLVPATIELNAPPRLPRDWFPFEDDDTPCIPTRRQRSVPLTLAEAVRRISRGRAPPFVSTCSL
jgi:hypothetical protein